MEAFEYIGYWWLPETPDRKVSGKLMFNPTDGVRLQTYDWIRLSNRIPLFDTYNVKIILGQTVQLGQVTLCGCSIVGDRCYIEYIFAGQHCYSENDLLLKEVAINYTYAEDWMEYSALSYSWETEDETDVVKKLYYQYTPPTKIEVKLLDFTATLSYRLTSESRGFHQTTLTQSVYLGVQPKQESDLDWYLQNIFYHMQNFLALGVNKPVYPHRVEGILKQSDKSVSIFYRMGYLTGERPEQSKLSDFMLFTYRDVADNLGVYFDNWFSKSEKLGQFMTCISEYFTITLNIKRCNFC